ncbi:MAG: heme lyase CcmF/NrfE family subunit [Gaiellales bacterium]
MPGLGAAALALALGLTLYATIAGAYAALRGRARLAASARNAFFAAFGACLLASVILAVAFVSDDFGFRYVADHSSRDLPPLYAFTAFWGGQEGSLLLWALILTAMGTAALWLNRRLVREALPWTVPILAAVAAFFFFLLVVVSSPFATRPEAVEGAGLNPSLQNPYMVSHPPMLYLGYVGLTIPFAFAMAALVSRRVDERWIVATRRWTLAAWTFLGLGILIGAKWAYEEVGWGGWYAWDPVENAALMPWLVATAYLHSVIVQEKKNMLRVWNVVLVALAFCLAVFGTFLTRSGVLNSIHAFAEGGVGPWLLAFICVVAAASGILILTRLPVLRAGVKMESLVSREAAFLYNNLFLVAFALTVLWGVAWPLISEAVRGIEVSTGPPYYDFFAVVFGLPLVVLMGLGPLVPWRRASLRALASSVAIPGLVAIACGVVLALVGDGSSPLGLIGYTFAAFVLAAIGLEFARGTRARKALGAASWPSAFTSLVARNRRRYGGYVVHAAIALLVIGAVGVGAFSSAEELRARPGDTVAVGGYTIQVVGITDRTVDNREEVRARLAVSRGGSDLGMLEAGKNRYFPQAQGNVTNEVAIRTDWLRAEDLFIIGEQFNEDGSVDLKLIVNPLVNLIWAAGLLFVLGSVVAMWPDAREQRRLERRLAESKVLAPT